MKTSITILGRKTDLLLLAGIVILTVFITINTLCNCKNCGKEEAGHPGEGLTCSQVC